MYDYLGIVRSQTGDYSVPQLTLTSHFVSAGTSAFGAARPTR